MGCVKRLIEALIYEAGPERAVDVLREVGFSEEDAQEWADAYYGDD